MATGPLGGGFTMADQEPSSTLAESRLTWQEESLGVFIDALADAGRAFLDQDEEELRACYRPITRAAVQQVRRNREKIIGIISATEAEARAQAIANREALRVLQELLPEGRAESPDGAPGATPSPAPPPPADLIEPAPPPARGGAVAPPAAAPPAVLPPVAAGELTVCGRWRVSVETDPASGFRVVWFTDPSGRRVDANGLIAQGVLVTTGHPDCLRDEAARLTREGYLRAGQGDTVAGEGYCPGAEPGSRQPMDIWVKCPESVPPPDDGGDEDGDGGPPDEEDEDEEGDEDEEEEDEDRFLAVPPTTCELDWSDPKICEHLDAFVREFALIGGRWRDTVDLVLTKRGDWEGLLKAFANLPLAGAPFKIIAGFSEGIGRFAETVRDTLDHWGNGRAGVKWAVLAGLYVTRAAIECLEDQDTGLSVPFKITVKINLELTQLKRVVRYLIEFVCPVDPPSVADTQAMYAANLINEEQAACLMATHGQQWASQEQVAIARRQQPTPAQLLLLHWRGRMGEEEFARKMRGQGWLTTEEVGLFREASQYMPPPSDLILFAVRDVWTPEKLGRAEMLEEYAGQRGLKEAFAANGMGSIRIAGFPAPGELMNVPESYWLAHYHEAAPGQVMEMFHRLRPDRVHRFALPTPDGDEVLPEPVLMDTVRRYLREVDQNPIWRDRLAAISYRTVGRIDLRRMYSLGVFGEPKGRAGFSGVPGGELSPVGVAERELVEGLMDFGFSRKDATNVAYFNASDYDRQQLSPIRQSLKTAMCNLYTLGGIDRAGFTRTLVDAGIPEKEADAAVMLCDARQAASVLKAHVGAARGSFLRGAMSEADVRVSLSRAGVLVDSVDYYIELWKLQRMKAAPETRAAELCQWRAMGIIDGAEMDRRLARQGFTDKDRLNILNRCELGILDKTAKETRRLERARISEARRIEAERVRAEKERVRNAERAAKERERRARQLAADTRREEAVPQMGVYAAQSIKDIKGWWKEEIIDEAAVRAMLARKRWLPEDVERWVKANRPGEG